MEKYLENWFYFVDGKQLTGWQKLKKYWDNDVFWFFYTWVMAKNGCFKIDGKQYSFNENGCLINK